MKMITATSPNRSSRGGKKPTLIVIHGDAGRTDKGTISWVQKAESQVSYHYLVGRDGAVYSIVPEIEKAWHAGRSTFHGEELQGSVNPISIGVAFANDGTGNEPYAAIQYTVGGELVADICKRHGIPVQRIRTHAEVSPGRKHDPWAWFDWTRFLGEVCAAMNKDAA